MKGLRAVSVTLIGGFAIANSAHAANITVAQSLVNPSASSTENAEAAAVRRDWREAMAKQPVPTKGCFHAEYPNYLWENVPCAAPSVPTSHSMPHRAASESAGRAAGDNMGDYFVQARGGLITYADGTFYAQTTGTTVKTVATANGNGNDDADSLGAGKYTLQLNTNSTKSGAVTVPLKCQQNPNHTADCYIWQQFIYSSDANAAVGNGYEGGAVFIQYWVYNWGDSSKAQCPTDGDWHGEIDKTTGHLNCWRNSEQITQMPVVPVTELTEAKLAGSLTFANDGTEYDVAIMGYGNEAWAATEEDRTLYISDVWDQVEFNIVGNLNSSNAQFSDGTVLGVEVNLRDGSTTPPGCVSNLTTNIGEYTAETNNFPDLASCVTSTNSGGYPTAEFLEGTSLSAIATLAQSLAPHAFILAQPITGRL